MAWLANSLITSASQTVSYYRGLQYVQVQATFGRKLLRLENLDGGVRTQWTDMDFLIRATDLILNGSPIFPTRKDVIVITAPLSVQSFEVAPYGPTDPPWRWSDPYQNMMRIHTKLINIQSAYGEPD
jgi:hypothetical protein